MYIQQWSVCKSFNGLDVANTSFLLVLRELIVDYYVCRIEASKAPKHNLKIPVATDAAMGHS